MTKRRQFLGNLVTAGAALALSKSMRSLATDRIIGANERIRVGIIGAGSRGQDLIKQLARVPNTELVAVADVYKRRQEEARQSAPKAKVFSDHRGLLDLKEVDAVIVASPLHCHARHFLDTLAAGKHLYAEKTMTWSIPEAEACRVAAQKSDRVIQIGLQHLSSGAHADFKQWVSQGWLGRIASVESWMSRNTPRGHGQWVRPVPSDCTAENVDWTAFLAGHPARPFDGFRFINWRLFWEFSGGNVTENMVHQMAFLMSILQLPLPEAASMSGGIFVEKDAREVPDTIAVTFEFPNDLIITWQSTFSNSHYGMGERILGSDGTAERLSGATDMVTGRAESLWGYAPEKINRPEGNSITGSSRDQDHMGNWIDCIRSGSGRTPNSPVEIGYRSAIAAHLANLSYRNKKRMTLAEAGVQFSAA